MGCEQEFGYKVWTVVDSELIHTKEVGCRGEIFVLCLISVWKSTFLWTIMILQDILKQGPI